jgi:bacterioferritin (cytochrome b1)
MIRQQKKELLKSNFQKMKRDADELAALAKLLQEELDKSSQDILSLQVVSKAEKIEKLAKKIKETARGY